MAIILLSFIQKFSVLKPSVLNLNVILICWLCHTSNSSFPLLAQCAWALSTHWARNNSFSFMLGLLLQLLLQLHSVKLWYSELLTIIFGSWYFKRWESQLHSVIFFKIYHNDCRFVVVRMTMMMQKDYLKNVNYETDSLRKIGFKILTTRSRHFSLTLLPSFQRALRSTVLWKS